MYPDAAPALVTFGIGGISAFVAIAAVWLVRFAARRVHDTPTGGGTVRAATVPAATVRAATIWAAAAVILWLIAVSALALSGVLASFDARPPPLGLFMGALVAAGLMLGLSRRTNLLVQGLPLAVLVGLQAFRLPLELVMHEAATSGVMPVQLSFTGYNFDILTGTLAVSR